MYCRFCEKYAKGQKTPNGKMCRVINKEVTRQSLIPEKKGVFCKEFEFVYTFWCPNFGHYKNYKSCVFKVKNYPDCLDCQDFEERKIAWEIFLKNSKFEIKRRNFISLYRRTSKITRKKDERR